MKKTCHTIRKQGKANEQELTAFLSKNGQGLLPMVELIEQSRIACDQLIDVRGRAVLQAVLQLSAAQVAGGRRQQGKRRSESVVFYGRQAGQVNPERLADPEPDRPRSSSITITCSLAHPSSHGFSTNAYWRAVDSRLFSTCEGLDWRM